MLPCDDAAAAAAKEIRKQTLTVFLQHWQSMGKTVRGSGGVGEFGSLGTGEGKDESILEVMGCSL